MITSIYKQQLQALAFQRAFWGIACLVLLPSPCIDSSLYLSFSSVCKATSVTHTKRIYRNLLRKETSFVCYTSSVLRKNRHMKQKEKITKQKKKNLYILSICQLNLEGGHGSWKFENHCYSICGKRTLLCVKTASGAWSPVRFAAYFSTSTEKPFSPTHVDNAVLCPTYTSLVINLSWMRPCTCPL